MKKLLFAMLFLGSIMTTFADDIDISSEQFNWIDDLEVLVKLHNQKEDTVAGLDINDNGIRDDIEQYISTAFKDDPFQKAIFLKAAVKLQTILTLPEDASVNRHLVLDKELLALYTCRDYILYRNNIKNIEQEMMNKNLFKRKVLDTKERLTAYIQHKQKIPANFYDMSEGQLDKDKKECLAIYYSFENKDTKNNNNSVTLVQ